MPPIANRRSADCQSAIQQAASLRYGHGADWHFVPPIANRRSADWQSAVSPVANRRLILKTPEPNPSLERVRHALRSDGLPHSPPNPLRSGIHSRGYLPHVKREGASYFVTFRLADSLPAEVLLELKRELAEQLRSLADGPAAERAAVNLEFERHTARQANRLLGRTGTAFWQPESYDHWIRDDEEKARMRRYIRNNPVAARLCRAPEEWRWSSAYLPAAGVGGATS